MEGKKSCCTPARGEPAGLSASTAPPQTTPHTGDGMISLPGGRFLMGTDYGEGFPLDGEGPVRPVIVSPFAMDSAPVTNSQFAAFVRQTAYVTDAQRFGWSFVFWAHVPEEHFEEYVVDNIAAAPWWCKVPGANWKSPEGPVSNIDSRADHPVTHVSHNDAAAYTAWAGKQLPTEAEWEFAARGGLVQKLYAWGDELTPGGKHLCNLWQGRFPVQDAAEDGFAGTCPVTAFPPNGYGLYSVAGNVWEWTNDWFGVAHSPEECVDPKGPAHGEGKVLKGGSFLCHASYCNRYRVAARTQNTPDSSTSNLGFRCIRRSA
jgi:sulfatase modifying factor 1